jgi:hypothetical protein
MVDDGPAARESAFDGASWVYLISSSAGLTGEDPVRGSVVTACEEGGWPVVSWPPEGTAQRADPDHLFEDVRHAVEHADCVIALLGQAGESADAELAIAYSHRRPIIGLRTDGERSSVSGVQAMLERYERARVVSCSSPDECASQVRAVLSDPGFGATIRQAVGEQAAAP